MGWKENTVFMKREKFQHVKRKTGTGGHSDFLPSAIEA
jgi:hypothetical protein